MARYYYLGIVLPSLHIGRAPELSYETFVEMMKEHLRSQDFELTVALRRYYDIQNIRRQWKKEPLSCYGNLDEYALEEALSNEEFLPHYVQAFLEQYPTTYDRLNNFTSLISDFFKEEIAKSKGFVKKYLSFERQLHLIHTAFRAKKLNRNLYTELPLGDYDDEFIEQLSLISSKEFVTPEDHKSLVEILEANYYAPYDLHLALCEYRFLKMEEFAGDKSFSIDRILATLMQLIMVEGLQKLDSEKGNKLADLYIGYN